jgi:hypothetical protein
VGRAQPDPLATQGCTYPRSSAAGQTGTSHNLGRPRGGEWIEIRLSPSRDGLEKVPLVRPNVACWAMSGRARCSAAAPHVVSTHSRRRGSAELCGEAAPWSLRGPRVLVGNAAVDSGRPAG